MHACLLGSALPSSLSLRAGPGFLDPHRYNCAAEAPFAIRFARGQTETETTEEEMPSPPRGRIMPRPTCCPTIKSLGAPWRFFAADVAWSGHLHGMQRSPSGVLVSLESLDRPLRSEMRMASRGAGAGARRKPNFIGASYAFGADILTTGHVFISSR